MDSPGGGILSRIFEKTLGWVILGLLVLAGVGIYQLGPAGRAAIWNAAWRTAAWIGFAVALPWISRLFLTRILEVGSNWAGAVLMGALVAVDALAGLILLAGWPTGAWGWLAALAALAAAGTYNYLVTEYLAQQADG